MPVIRSDKRILRFQTVEFGRIWLNCFCDQRGLRRLYSMRFFSFQRSRSLNRYPANYLRPHDKPSPIPSAATPCALLVALFFFAGTASIVAQPPGTQPPKNIFDKQKESESPNLPIRAFLFLSESGNPVIMPGMTWEKLQRLMDLDGGNDGERDKYTYQSLAISGSTDGGRAELEIVLKASVEPTANRWISIPLKMGNFHQLAPPDVTGVDEYNTRLLPDGTGYQLRVKTDIDADVVLRLRAAARVQSGSLSRSLEFRLPDVASKVELKTDSKNATGEVMGRGDETAIPEVGEDELTKFSVESSGGTFFLRWGETANATEDQLLEAESRVSVRWVSPRERPVASIRTTIQSLRGSIDRFRLRLPAGAVMVQPPQLDSTGQLLESNLLAQDANGSVHDVVIPEEERRPRIDISYDLQLSGKRATSRQPLGLQIPEIVGAIRHSGELEIRTSGDFRLRWRSRPWIHAEPISDQTVGETRRTYRFQFDRVTSDFKIWLGRKESQLRMVSHAVITIQDSIASLEMTIRAGGQMPEGNLTLDEASWQLKSIENLRTETPLDWFPSESDSVIEIESSNEANPARIRIRADFPLDLNEDRVELPLPRVVNLSESAFIQNATVDIISTGRSVFVVDLNATRDLRRTSISSGNTNGDRLTSHFQVLDLVSPVVIVGNLVDQPAQITLSGDARVELDGRQLRTKVDWILSSRTDLEGRLPIRIPTLATSPSAAKTESSAAGQEILDSSGFLLGVRWDRKDTLNDSEPSPWIVTVNDAPAILRALDDDRYELISDRLTDGSMTIRWQNVVTLRNDYEVGSISSVSLPRPNLADLTIRGTIDVELEGNQRFSLVAIDSPGSSDLQLDSLPRDPVLLRLNPRQTSRQELSVQQSILTTVVGRQTRHEQLLARVQRGEQFRVGLPKSIAGTSIKEISVRGFIDGESAIVRHDQNMLVMTLPGDEIPHNVDLRVWFPKETASAFAMVEPTLKLPPGSGRMFWQIVTPSDGHIVWTTPTLGRSMKWRFDGWNLYRSPTHSASQLAAMVPSVSNSFPTRNRYLYVGSDIPSFQVLVISNAFMWLMVGTLILIASALLTHVRSLRHPLTVVAIAVLFAGLLVIAPDAAVLTGQLGIISSVLVIVMITIRALLTPTRSDRVFAPDDAGDPSSQDRSVGGDRTSIQQPNVPTTRTTPSPSPTEASS